ncbi:alpha/beta hydrolase [Patescibacteria group bacterium]
MAKKRSKSTYVIAGIVGVFAILGIMLYVASDSNLVTNLAYAPGDKIDPIDNVISDTAITADDSNVSYGKNSEPLQRYDMYLPDNPNGNIMVHVHGGSWWWGDKQDQLNVDRAEVFSGKASGRNAINADEHYAVAVINYRLQSATLQQQADDVALAVKHVLETYGSRYGTSQIILSGGSAGGHLAALVATDESHLQNQGLSFANIKGVALLDAPALDLDLIRDSYKSFYHDVLEFAFGPLPQGEGTEYMNWIINSPKYHADSAQNLPPILGLYSNWNAPIKNTTFSLLDASNNDKDLSIISWLWHEGTIIASHEKGRIRDGNRRSDGVIDWMENL